MKNCIFTNEEIAKFNFYNAGIAYFDVDYEADDEDNLKMNRRAASSNFEILKFDSCFKVAVFKDSKGKIYYTSLQGCTCKQFEKSEYTPCVHIFKLAQELKIIDKETGILLQPQSEIEEFFVQTNESEKTSIPVKEVVSTVGIGKHCKHCNSIMNFDDDVCPHCKNNQNSEIQTTNYNYKNGCLVALAIAALAIIASIFL